MRASTEKVKFEQRPEDQGMSPVGPRDKEVGSCLASSGNGKEAPRPEQSEPVEERVPEVVGQVM